VEVWSLSGFVHPCKGVVLEQAEAKQKELEIPTELGPRDATFSLGVFLFRQATRFWLMFKTSKTSDDF